MMLFLMGGGCLLGYLGICAAHDRIRLHRFQRNRAHPRRRRRAGGGRRRASIAGENAAPQEVLLAILAGASARLSAGAAPEQAWAELPGSGAQGGLGRALRAVLPAPEGWHREATGQVIARAIAQVEAADDLARSRGMSLARLLARVQAGLETELELHTAQVSALTPARTSARLLRWLPVLGLGLGALLGLNPAAVLLGSGVGRASLLGAIICVLAGNYWSKALLRRALLPPGD